MTATAPITAPDSSDVRATGLAAFAASMLVSVGMCVLASVVRGPYDAVWPVLVITLDVAVIRALVTHDCVRP
jgi:hypothetical protein